MMKLKGGCGVSRGESKLEFVGPLLSFSCEKLLDTIVYYRK